jgi:hypothetical protein
VEKKPEKRPNSIHRKLSRMGVGKAREKTSEGTKEGEGGESAVTHHRKLSRVGKGGARNHSQASTEEVIGDRRGEKGVIGGRNYDVIDELTRDMFGEDRPEEDESLVDIDFL